MGKQKKKRLGKQATNGLGAVESSQRNGEQGDTPSSHVDGYIENILDNLRSSSLEDRECACTILASVVNKPGAVSQLLEAQVVKIMGPFFINDSLSLRQVAVGCTKNMCLEAGPDGCKAMVEQDIMTPLVSLLKQYDDTDKLKPGPDSSRDVVNMQQDILINGTNLLWNLCENSEIALEIFNRQSLTDLLLAHLEPALHGSLSIAVAMAQCLNTVSEDNPPVSTIMCKDSVILKLKTYLESKHTNPQEILFRTLITAIYYNCVSRQITSGSFTESVVSALADCLGEDAASYIVKLDSQVHNGGIQVENCIDMETDESHNKTDPTLMSASIRDKHTDEIHAILQAQQLALQILTNLCCSYDEDEWEELDSSDASSDDTNASDSMENTEESSLLAPLCLASEVHGAFVNHDLVNLVLSKVTPLDQTVLEKIHHHTNYQKIMRGLDMVQSCALLCVSNMCSGMDGQSLGGLDGLHQTWEGLTKILLNKSAHAKPEVMEGITSAMRSIIQKLAELDSPKFAAVGPRDLQFIFELGHKSDVLQVRVNADIGVFLLVISVKDSEMWVIAEALDAIFDVFAEDHVNGIIKEINLINKLTQLAPVLKTKIFQRKKSLGAHLAIVSTVKTNLMRFINYKSALM